MKLISLFSGIGGFELAAEWAGWQNVVSCEINPFGRQVLNHYWPNAYHHDDIKTLTFEKIDHELKQRFGENWNGSDLVLKVNEVLGTRSHLNPRFVAEMMGFPPNWLELPFQNTEKNP